MNCKDQQQRLETNDSITILTKELIEYQSHSEPNQMTSKITEIKESLVTEPRPPTLFYQGEFLKPQAGTKDKYVSRWLRIYQNEIRCYKNEYSSCFWEHKPISKVRFNEIKGINESCVDGVYWVELVTDENTGMERMKNNTWQSKMKDHKSHKKRFIFASKDKKEINKWAIALKDLINHN